MATEIESTKRTVTFSTYQKWRRDFDSELKTVTWMDCATETSDGKTYVTHLKCTICAKYKCRIIGRRNYSDRWITGADSLRTSTIRDHAKSDQHQHAMSILCLEKGSATRGELSVCSAPIIAAITSLSHKDRAELHKKFDIVFLLAKEKLSFHKYPSICELEERHDVQLGSTYRTEKAARSLCHYIAQCQRLQLVETVKFFHCCLMERQMLQTWRMS